MHIIYRENGMSFPVLATYTFLLKTNTGITIRELICCISSYYDINDVLMNMHILICINTKRL